MGSTTDLGRVEDVACVCAFGGQRMTDTGFFEAGPLSEWEVPYCGQVAPESAVPCPPIPHHTHGHTHIHHADSTYTGVRQR